MTQESWNLLGKTVTSGSFDDVFNDCQNMCIVLKREKGDFYKTNYMLTLNQLFQWSTYRLFIVLRKKSTEFISHVKITMKYQVTEIIVLKEWHSFRNKVPVDFSKDIACKDQSCSSELTRLAFALAVTCSSNMRTVLNSTEENGL